METFSQKIKQEISALNTKTRNCCAYSFLYGMIFPQIEEEGLYKVNSAFVENAISLHEKMNSLFQKHPEYYKIEKRRVLINKEVIRCFTIAEYEQRVFKCQRCFEHFLRGVFFACGTSTSPEKEHRIDLNFDNYEHAIELQEFLLDKSLKFNLSTRNNKTILYIKRSESIEDFLALMGATNSAFEMMNSKINNEVRNVANRATNCDSANINKSLNASKSYIKAINTIIKKGYFDELPIGLQEIARARLEYPDISIEELGKRLTPKISKSGVHHRLEKLISFYDKIKN